MSQHRYRRAGLASAAAIVAVLAGAAAPAAAATPAMTLSRATGASGGGNTIIGTASVAAFPSGTTPAVQFQTVGSGSTLCSATAKPVTQIAGSAAANTAGVLTADPANVIWLTTSKVAFQVPSGVYPALGSDGNPSTVNTGGLALLSGQTSAKWNVCVYDSDSTTLSTLLATSTYTLAAFPTITSITPISSPAAGGQTITVTGTGFSTAGTPMSGSIDGVALTKIQVASTGNSFTAVTGPHAAATGLTLTLVTPGGTVTSVDPDNNGQPQDADSTTNDAPITFSYSNGITIGPTTAASGTKVNIDVVGAGFSALTFDGPGDPTSTEAHIFLVKGAYTPTTNRGVAECVVVAVVSDTELACALDLSAYQLRARDSTPMSGVPIADGAYILTVVANGDTAAGGAANPTIISSGSAFVVAPY